MFIYNDDMERLMQAKKREILYEIEQTKDRILCELSGVDKCTLEQLRNILNQYNHVEYMITTKMNAIEERVITFTGAYGDNLGEVKEELLADIRELEKTFIAVNSIANEALTIAKGKNRARVFATTEEMNAFLSSPDSVGKLQIGDNLYIVALNVPDWWVSEVYTTPNSEGKYYNVAQLETQKVDLTPINNSIMELSTKNTAEIIATNGNNSLTFYFEKYGKLVTCRVGGVMSLESINKTYVFNNGGAVIPEGYKPSIIQYSILNLVAGEVIDGVARFAFNPDGTVAFISTKTDAREYNTTITWMTN